MKLLWNIARRVEASLSQKIKRFSGLVDQPSSLLVHPVLTWGTSEVFPTNI